MKVLLSGVTGFLGSYLGRALVKSGHNVVALKRSCSKTNRVEDFIGQLSIYNVDQVDLHRVFSEHPDIEAVIHSATSYGRDSHKNSDLVESNVLFPLKLIDLANDVGVKVFFNTETFFNKKVYNYRYLEGYSKSKSQFVDWVKLISDRQTCFVNIYLEHLYGPRDNPRKFIPYVLAKMVSEASHLELSPGEQKRDFVFVDDVVDCYMKLLCQYPFQKGGFLEYEVGTGRMITIRELVETAKELMSSNIKLEFGALTYRENEIMESCAELATLRGIDWGPKVSLREGLQRTIQNFIE